MSINFKANSWREGLTHGNLGRWKTNKMPILRNKKKRKGPKLGLPTNCTKKNLLKWVICYFLIGWQFDLINQAFNFLFSVFTLSRASLEIAPGLNLSKISFEFNISKLILVFTCWWIIDMAPHFISSFELIKVHSYHKLASGALHNSQSTQHGQDAFSLFDST